MPPRSTAKAKRPAIPKNSQKYAEARERAGLSYRYLRSLGLSNDTIAKAMSGRLPARRSTRKLLLESIGLPEDA